jgi:hypothetical protein
MELVQHYLSQVKDTAQNNISKNGYSIHTERKRNAFKLYVYSLMRVPDKNSTKSKFQQLQPFQSGYKNFK